ncbi:hypothetical protein PABG_11938 [Paracoccidioides brasiliensis Pb03]|nr:hypothetical protein PABG_11938 [Paracoccidioides brasiliensis Pb03]
MEEAELGIRWGGGESETQRDTGRQAEKLYRKETKRSGKRIKMSHKRKHDRTAGPCARKSARWSNGDRLVSWSVTSRYQ